VVVVALLDLTQYDHGRVLQLCCIPFANSCAIASVEVGWKFIGPDNAWRGDGGLKDEVFNVHSQ